MIVGLARKTRQAGMVVLCWLVLALPAAAETLLIFGDDAYAPVLYQRPGGVPEGVLVQTLRRAERITGDHYDLQLMPWKRAYELARRGDGGLIGVSYTQERAAIFDYSHPMYDDDIRIVTLKGREFTFGEIGDLKGKLLGGVRGASYGEQVDSAIAAGLIRVDRDIGQVSRLRKVLAGRLDAALIGNGQAGLEAVIVSHPELLANRDRFSVLGKPLARDPLHLAFPKQLGKTEALARFNDALEKLGKQAPSRPGR